ncbi:MAG: hypothetical protein ACE5I5_17315 [Candidatus Heimdallarchaeota archaeon]
MVDTRSPWIKAVLAIIVLLFAIVRFVFYDFINERVDDIFLLLLTLAALILLFPWERLTSLKAAGIELSLEQPQIKGALEGLEMNRLENEQLKQKILSKAREIEQAQGSRIIWIDDKPHNIVGERRILRALGVEVVTAISSEMAEEIFSRDNDFDMIISDVQRKGESYKLNNGVPIHEGVNFIVKLRQHEDPVIMTLPVTFYAAYNWPRLVEFTRPARETQPEPQICNTIAELLIKVLTTLSEVRSHPIKVRAEKRPTRV